METDADNPVVTTPILLELIAELKHDIANIAIEMQAKFKQTEILKSTNQSHSTSATWTQSEPVWVFLSPL